MSQRNNAPHRTAEHNTAQCFLSQCWLEVSRQHGNIIEMYLKVFPPLSLFPSYLINLPPTEETTVQSQIDLKPKLLTTNFFTDPNLKTASSHNCLVPETTLGSLPSIKVIRMPCPSFMSTVERETMLNTTSTGIKPDLFNSGVTSVPVSSDIIFLCCRCKKSTKLRRWPLMCSCGHTACKSCSQTSVVRS